MVATERHSDGGIHHHALVGFDRVYDCTSNRAFDVGGRHANIARVRNLRAAYRYACKDGDYDDTYLLGIERGPFAEACRASDRSEFLRIIEEKRPRDFVLYHDRLMSFANKRFKEEPEEHHPVHTEFDLPEDLASWVANEFPKVPRKRSCGASATLARGMRRMWLNLYSPAFSVASSLSRISVALI